MGLLVWRRGGNCDESGGYCLFTRSRQSSECPWRQVRQKARLVIAGEETYLPRNYLVLILLPRPPPTAWHPQDPLCAVIVRVRFGTITLSCHAMGDKHTQPVGLLFCGPRKNRINSRPPAFLLFLSLSPPHPATQQKLSHPPSIIISLLHPFLHHLIYCNSANKSLPGAVQIGGGCPDSIRTSPPDLDTPPRTRTRTRMDPPSRIRMDDSEAYGGHFTADAACVKAFAYVSIG